MVYCETRLGTLREWYSKKPEDADLPLPHLITSCLGFLVSKKKANKKTTERYEGTAFFVSVPSETGGTYLYLVTAKHITEGIKEGATLYLRLNVFNRKLDDIKLTGEWKSLKGKPDVDVAVMSFEPLDKNYWFWDAIPYGTPELDEFERKNMFADKHALRYFRIGVGDDVRVVGLFSEHAGKERNLPVVRGGIIAAMPSEPLEVEIDKFKRKFYAYLIEVRSIGGLSGSPVFVLNEVLTMNMETGQLMRTAKYRFFLLGMIRGHWDYKKQYSLSGVVDKELDQVNMGMAYVTPIQNVIDVLYGDEMKEQRKRDDGQTPSQSRSVAVEDSNKNSRKASELTQGGFEDALRRVSRKVSGEEQGKESK